MKKITIDILKQGHHNDAIVRAIGSHNEGKADISLTDIAGYVNFKKAEYPTLYPNCTALISGPEKWPSLFISDDGGKTQCLIIKAQES